MAIQMRRGQLADFNPAKMLPGEWAVSTDADTGDQHVYMCFRAGVVKRIATYEDFGSDMEALHDAITAATTAVAGANDAITKANNLVANKVGIDDTDVSLTKTWSSSYLNDSLVNNFGGTNLLKGTKDFSGMANKTYVTTDTYRDFTIARANRTSEATTVFNDFAWNSFLEPEPDTWYTLSFWAKGTGVLSSYFHPSTISQGISSTGATNIATDGRIITTVTSDWKRYWISWKTLSTVSGDKNVIAARVFGGNDIYLCGVMFERGQYAHDWNYSPKDVAIINENSTAVTTYDPSDYLASGVEINATRSYMKKIGKQVYVQLYVTSGLSSGDTVLTLPSELRPGEQVWSACFPVYGGTWVGRTNIVITGGIQVLFSGITTPVTGVVFKDSYVLS